MIGLIYGGGTVLSEVFFIAVDRRIERKLMRTLSYPYYIELTYAFSSYYENGSYQERVLAEYIRGIQTRAEALIAAFQSSPPTS